MMDWLAQAKTLRVGRSARFKHCGPGSAAAVHNDVDRYWWYCHRCHESGSQSKVMRLSEVARELQAAKQAESEVRWDYPTPRVYDPLEWPVEAALWPLKAGFTYEEVRAWGLYYCPKIMRVVIPVGKFFQARAVFPGQSPKYLNPPGDKPLGFHYGRGDPVLTEDCMSAYRVATAGYAGFPLFGTSPTVKLIAALIRMNRPVTVWLDPDAAGAAGTRQAVRKLELVGIPVFTVSSKRDPKHYTKLEVRELINVSRSEHTAAAKAPQELGGSPGSSQPQVG